MKSEEAESRLPGHIACPFDLLLSAPIFPLPDRMTPPDRINKRVDGWLRSGSHSEELRRYRNVSNSRPLAVGYDFSQWA